MRFDSLAYLVDANSICCCLDLHKVFIDDESYNSGHGHAYEKYGIDPEIGATVIVRPDQCNCYLTRWPFAVYSSEVSQLIGVLADVSKVIPIDDTQGIGELFDRFVVPQEQTGTL